MKNKAHRKSEVVRAVKSPNFGFVGTLSIAPTVDRNNPTPLRTNEHQGGVNAPNTPKSSAVEYGAMVGNHRSTMMEMTDKAYARTGMFQPVLGQL